MAQNLNGKKIAMVTDGFEQVELTDPKKALEAAGAQTQIVSPARLRVQGWNHYEKGDTFSVDVPLDQAKVEEYDALFLPGGVANPDHCE
jgi:deglycase